MTTTNTSRPASGYDIAAADFPTGSLGHVLRMEPLVRSFADEYTPAEVAELLDDRGEPVESWSTFLDSRYDHEGGHTNMALASESVARAVRDLVLNRDKTEAAATRYVVVKGSACFRGWLLWERGTKNYFSAEGRVVRFKTEAEATEKAAELNTTTAPASGTETDLVIVTNDLGEVLTMARQVFEHHYSGFGWRITTGAILLAERNHRAETEAAMRAPAAAEPQKLTAPAADEPAPTDLHDIDIREGRHPLLFGASCICGWLTGEYAESILRDKIAVHLASPTIPAPHAESRAGVLLGEWRPITREQYWRLRDQHRADLTVWAEHNTPGREDYVAEAFRSASVPFIDFRTTLDTEHQVHVEFRRFVPRTLADAGTSVSWHGNR